MLMWFITGAKDIALQIDCFSLVSGWGGGVR